MWKDKGVGKMEVSQGSLGVRTRARSLALEKEKASKFSSLDHTTTSSSSKASESTQAPPLESEPHYMELRSRRLEKVARCEKEKEHDPAEDHDVAQASAKNSSSSRPSPFLSPSPVELDMLDEESSRMRRQNSSNSRPDFSLLASAAATAGSDAISHIRLPPPAQSSVKGSSFSTPAARTASSTQSLGHSSASIPQKRSMGMLTRNQRQELACSLANQEAMEVDTEMVLSEAARPSGNNQREMEVEPCFGESPTIAGPSSKDRRTRECTPDSFIRDVEAAPGSTSRTRRSSQVRSISAPPLGRSSEAPSSREIEAFFSSAEQQERRRFIERYNFDPLTERPLRGRYEWLDV